MKFKMTVAAGVLASVLAASDARAECTLSVSPSSYIWRGQHFSFNISNPPRAQPGPQPETPPQFTVVFYGTGIQLYGEAYPGTVGYGDSVLTGFYNPPEGGFSGGYQRLAVLYSHPSGAFYCSTNTVTVSLE